MALQDINGFIWVIGYKSYDTNLGKITPDYNNKSIYFDKYNELDKNKFAKFLELLKKNGYEFNVLKTSSITIIEFEEKFNWKNIEKIIKGI